MFDDHCVLDSYQGLLVLQRDHDTAIRLLHPFTGDLVDLPPLSTLLPQMRDLIGLRPARRKLPYLRSFSTAATFADGVVTVLLAFYDLHRVAVATSQDHQWTMPTWYYEISCRPFPHQGKLYVVHRFGTDFLSPKIFRIDTPLPGEELQPPKVIATTADKLRGPIFFVECDSEVLVIGYGGNLFSKMLVYKLADIVMERYIPVTGIGDKAIFIQAGTTLSVSAKALPTVVGDTITCFQPMEHYLALYHLSTGSWSPAMDQCSLRGTEPGPSSLIQHIYTCCSWKHRY